MRTLLVQTACNYHQVTLYDGPANQQKIIADWRQEQARETLSFLMRVLNELEQHPKPELIIFIQGPGSFTALRVGATWVNAYAYANKLTLKSFNTLQFIGLLTANDPKKLALTFDHKRFFVYEGDTVIAVERAPSMPIIAPDKSQPWFTNDHIEQLTKLSAESKQSTDVLYVIPPKITVPKQNFKI